MASFQIPRPQDLKSPDFKRDTYITRGVNFNQSYAAIDLAKFLKDSLQGRFIDDTYRRPPWTFLLKNPHIDDDDEAEGSWSARRMLGEGGFGTVGLWEKTTTAGYVVDEMAVKEVHCAEWGIDGRPGLSREASINRDINVQDQTGTTNFLRAFKHNPPTSYSRYYMIFSPHGTLEDLKDRYRSWDTHLNELFIYHVLIELCKALLVLEKEPPTSTLGPLPDWPTRYGLFAIHRDIKPENIFLDYANPPETGKDLPTFPRVRLADFGLTIYLDGTVPTDHGNDAGTPGYLPPEQTEHGRQKWHILPPTLPYQKSHNVWAIGKVAFDIMCNFESRWLEEYWMDKATGDSIMNRMIADPDDEHFMDPDFAEMLRDPEMGWTDAAEDMPYTEEIMRIVFDCLKPTPVQRPSTADVLQRSIEARADWLHGREMGKKSRVYTVRDEARLYFEKNEINNMPRGAANYPNDESYAKLYKRQQQRGDPDWPCLQGPLDKWGHLNVRRTSDSETVKEPKVPKIPVMIAVDDEFNIIRPHRVIMASTTEEAEKARMKAKKEHLAKKAADKAPKAPASVIQEPETGRSTRSNTAKKAPGKRKRPDPSEGSSSDDDEPIPKRGRPTKTTKAPAKPKKPIKKATSRPPAKTKGKGKAPVRKAQSSSSDEEEEAAPSRNPVEPSPRKLRSGKRLDE